MNMTATPYTHRPNPIARIVTGQGPAFGEITGELDLVALALEKMRAAAEIFGCNIALLSEAGDYRQYTIHVGVTPRRNHLLGDNPEWKLLHQMFSDERPEMKGPAKGLYYQ